MTRDLPIIFSAPMVRAILDGRKTQTRRELPNGRRPGPMMPDTADIRYDAESGELYCELGRWHARARWRPGDRLWVKEAWRYYDWTEDGQPWIESRSSDMPYLAEPPESEMTRIEDTWRALSAPENFTIANAARDPKWRPSTHMPRWASRITLLVTAVRVERLQDISEDDAMAEGIDQGLEHAGGQHCYDYSTGFRNVWNHIHGPDAWGANPWVSVTTFERIEK